MATPTIEILNMLRDPEPELRPPSPLQRRRIQLSSCVTDMVIGAVAFSGRRRRLNRNPVSVHQPIQSQVRHLGQTQCHEPHFLMSNRAHAASEQV
jgi:hypothetical protein